MKLASAVVLVLRLAGLFGVAVPMVACASALASGDLLIGTGGGVVAQYRNGVRVGELDTGTHAGGMVLGLCASINGEYLFAALSRSGSSGNLYRFNSQGVLQGQPQASGSWAAFAAPARGCTTDRAGHVFVLLEDLRGQPGTAQLIKYKADGSLLASYKPADVGLAVSVDLSRDQCTLVYAASGKVRRFDVCSGVQQTDLDVSALAGACRQVRMRRGGDMLLACFSHAYRLSEGGQLLNTYDAALCRADQPNAVAYASFSTVDLSADDQALWASLPPAVARSGRECNLQIDNGAFKTVVDLSEPALSTFVYGQPLAAARNCSRRMGKVQCLDALLPYKPNLPGPTAPRVR